MSELAAEATAFDLTANVLAHYTTDCPIDLAELMVTLDARHHKLFTEFTETMTENRVAVIPILKHELTKTATRAKCATTRATTATARSRV